jgi:CRP-like cAMP-binding protein
LSTTFTHEFEANRRCELAGAMSTGELFADPGTVATEKRCAISRRWVATCNVEWRYTGLEKRGESTVDIAHSQPNLAEFGQVRRRHRILLGNSLLDELAEPAFHDLEPKLERVALSRGRLLHAARQPIAHVHFPTLGLVSLMARDRHGRRLEVGMVGRDGMVGASEALTDGSPAVTEAVVQVPGEAWRVATAELIALLRLNRTLQTSLLRCVHAFTEEMAQTALAIGHGTIEQRLARWLLTAASRSERSGLEITHEQLSRLLAVRRSGITVALHVLEGSGAIKADRRMIEITDRAGLQRAANGFA